MGEDHRFSRPKQLQVHRELALDIGLFPDVLGHSYHPFRFLLPIA